MRRREESPQQRAGQVRRERMRQASRALEPAKPPPEAHARLSPVGTGGGGTYLPDTRFRGNALTSDARQWARLVAQAGSWPELTLGGATYGWIAAARAEMARLAAMPSPEIPALIGVGGAEAVVSQTAIRRRASSWPQARLLELPGARHELMFDHSAPDFMAAVERLFAA